MTTHDPREALAYWPPWTDQAACTQPGVDPNWWHSPDPDDRQQAITTCTTCPVRAECLRDYGHEPDGIIAGLTPARRGRLLAKLTLDIRPAHGTRSRYIGSTRWPGCRCDPCTAAHAQHEREARARRKAARAAGQRNPA